MNSDDVTRTDEARARYIGNRGMLGVLSVSLLLAVMMASLLLWGYRSTSERIHRSTPSSVQNLSIAQITPTNSRQQGYKAVERVGSIDARKTSATAVVFDTDFQVSQSVEAHCELAVQRGYGDSCEAVHRDLATMAQELRDEGWATGMESELQNYFEQQSLQGFSVRNVECRTSMCAIEVVANRDQHLIFVFGGPIPIARHLNPPDYFAIGVETNSAGNQSQVVLATYRRKGP